MGNCWGSPADDPTPSPSTTTHISSGTHKEKNLCFLVICLLSCVQFFDFSSGFCCFSVYVP